MSSPNQQMLDMMPDFAKPFTDVNSIEHVPEEHYLKFAKPWQITLQSLGGTYLHKTVNPWRTLFLLELHVQDDHHLAQRFYSNAHERALQAAIYCTPLAKQQLEARKKIFIKSLIGPSNQRTVIPFPAHFCPVVELFDVAFTVHGMDYEVSDALIRFTPRYTFSVLRMQTRAAYYNNSFEPAQGQSCDVMAFWRNKEQAVPEEKRVLEPAEPEPEAKKPKPNVDECVICLEDLAEAQKAVVVPCGHANYCWDCVQKIETCSICRQRVNQCFKIFQ